MPTRTSATSSIAISTGASTIGAIVARAIESGITRRDRLWIHCFVIWFDRCASVLQERWRFSFLEWICKVSLMHKIGVDSCFRGCDSSETSRATSRTVLLLALNVKEKQRSTTAQVRNTLVQPNFGWDTWRLLHSFCDLTLTGLMGYFLGISFRVA